MTDDMNCHCGRPATYGYRDRAAWPRRSATGAATEQSPDTAMIWFCAEHRFAQCYADEARDLNWQA
jgi:hypothetical protein